MKKYLFWMGVVLPPILIILLCFSSCSKKVWKTSEPIKLRQLVKKDTRYSEASGGFFLVTGGFSSSSEIKSTVQMFGDVGGYYKFIEVDIEDIRVKIDNSIDTPYAVIMYYEYNHFHDSSREALTRGYWGVYQHLIIVCPEKYLPEKLLPIKL